MGTDEVASEYDDDGIDEDRVGQRQRPAGLPEEVADAEVNLAIFEALLGATRIRMADGNCGLAHRGVAYPCFPGHDLFDDQGLWTTRYGGPEFCHDLTWAFAAQEAVSCQGLVEPYLEALMMNVYPDYAEAEDREQVMAFWFALAHASPRHRARAAAWAIQESHRVDRAVAEELRAELLPAGLEALVEAAIELAEPLDIERFVAFVGGLDPEDANQLLATMYVGRGDHDTLAGALRAIRYSVARDGPAIVGRRMVAKGPLVQYLTDGLAKLRAVELR